MTHTSLICTGHCRLPTEYGEFEMQGFDCGDGKEHIVLSIGNIADGKPVLVRIHSECLTGDAFHSKRCDCGAQLQSAMQIIQNEVCVIIFIFQFVILLIFFRQTYFRVF